MDSPREDLMAAAELSSAPWQVLELHSISPAGGVAMTSKQNMPMLFVEDWSEPKYPHVPECSIP